MNFAPSFFESSVRIILSSCTSNLFAHPNGSTVAAIPVYTIAKINRKPTAVILSRLNKTWTSHCILLCSIIYYCIIMCGTTCVRVGGAPRIALPSPLLRSLTASVADRWRTSRSIYTPFCYST